MDQSHPPSPHRTGCHHLRCTRGECLKPDEIGLNGFLRHIYQETTFITQYLATITYQEYNQNLSCKYALTRSLEILGEAFKHIPKTYWDQHPEISWKIIAGNRDTLIHGYFTIDYNVLWDTVTNDIPDLRKKIGVLIGEQPE